MTSRAFDDRGNVIRQTDALQRTSHYVRDARGRLLRHTDPVGRTTNLRRDAWGRLVEAIDPAGFTWTIERDDVRCVHVLRDPRGNATVRRFDSRGLLLEESLPDGTTQRLTYDQHGNVVARTAPNGARTTFAHDWLGRCVSQTDASGNIVHASYSPRGRLISLRDAHGADLLEYDGAGQLVRYVDRDGAVHRYVWGHSRKLLDHVFPDGSVVSRRYDLEGRMVELVNELGQTYRCEVDPMGLVTEERFFDGRVVRHRYDAAGQRVRTIEPGGRSTTFEYNDSGQTTRVEYADGSFIGCSYDARGLLVGLTSPGVQISYERDELGLVTRESQTVGDDIHWVQTSYDPMRRLAARETSAGHVLSVGRDSRADVSGVVLDGAGVTIERDAMGRDVRRLLPDGGAVISERDDIGRLRRVAVYDALARSTADTRWRYSAGGNVIERDDKALGAVAFTYDLRQRLVSVLPSRGEERRYAYRANGDVLEADEAGAVPRTYGAGGRLLARGEARYAYDDAGRIIEKTVRRGDVLESWRYEWDARGFLAGVTKPDGARIAYVYDAIGRRLEKRAVRLGKIVERTRYVWDGQCLVHAIDASVDAMRVTHPGRVATYCFEGDAAPTPWAVQEAYPRDDVGTGAPWTFFVTDASGAPIHRVDAGGKLVATADREEWGADSVMELGFSGQIVDRETGLH